MIQSHVDCIQVADLIKAYPKDPWFKVTENSSPLLKSDGLWCKDDKLVIPNDDRLKDKVLVQAHDSIFAGHPGRTKTYDLVTGNFWWPGVWKAVAEHCETCNSCQ
jgi:hypothetical protein